GLIGMAQSSVQAMVALMNEADLPKYIELANLLRAGGINTEVQLEPKKLGKQFQYASKAGIRFVLVLGEDEMAKGTVSVKDMPRELQYEVPRAELAKTLRVEIEQLAAMPKGLAS